MKIIVTHKTEFGKDRFYPENQNAKTLLELMGQRSFTKQDLQSCKAAKWDIEILSPKVEL